MMKISRKIDGKLVEIELTDDEKRQVFEEETKKYHREDVEQFIKDNAEFIIHEYGITIEEATEEIDHLVAKFEENTLDYGLNTEEAIKMAFRQTFLRVGY
ncbi:MAG: hypothetical protein IKP68_06265 [Clostridia bacterium]|nr:hypothetical protein [Clostridia bacterium]